MNNRWKVTIAAGLAAAGIAIFAGNPFKSPKVVEALKLTPEQQQKLEETSYQHQKEAANLRRDMQLKRLDLQRELDKENPDQAILDKLIDEQAALRAQAGKARVEQMLAVKKILTPEQWAKAKELRQERRAERMGGRHGRNRGGEGGRGDGWGMGPEEGIGGPPGQSGSGGPGPGDGPRAHGGG